jgi:peptidoglycan hydrolase-like protein with peptidoglycan-binding domain
MMLGLDLASTRHRNACDFNATHKSKENKMRKFFMAVLTLLLAFSTGAMAQNENANSTNPSASTQNANSTKKKRGPVFRANKDQIKQAQAILKERGFYAGEQTGKLDADTRAGLKKYQEAESLKVTGTLNKVTLEKMNITLTERQKAIQ